MSWEISELDQSDTAKIADVQTQSWALTYATALPAEYLAGPMARDIAARWARPLTESDLLVGAKTSDGGLIGFAAVILAKGKVPYIDNFHLLPSAYGTGVAAHLMEGVVQSLVERGFDRMYLTVLTTNARARAFYAKMGGIEGPEGPDDMFGQKVTSIPVSWDNLTGFRKNIPKR